ncbi:unnamed protein product [Protopolystoma xenopodis]|uniref:Uncharacterized protein n=1 Tax=Protopolystoma xenopodis TaxID=117903 RepID=A0A448WVN2_9PLAT|nr:unnamed protein product [Protopolystoma xenopodis]
MEHSESKEGLSPTKVSVLVGFIFSEAYSIGYCGLYSAVMFNATNNDVTDAGNEYDFYSGHAVKVIV